MSGSVRAARSSQSRSSSASSRSRKGAVTESRWASSAGRVMGKKRPTSSKTTRAAPPVQDDGEHENDIKFTNVESKSSALDEEMPAQTLEASDVLEKCGEAEYEDVYQIDLHGNKITEIPNLEKFTRVRMVDLSSNKIRAISRLECCTELRELKLYDNRLDSIQKLDALTNLSQLHLQHNRIHKIGKGLANSRQLTCLRLDSNLLTSLQTRELATLSKLVQLDLSNNKLDDVTALNSLPSLAELTLSNNRIRTMDLSRCKKLKEIDISRNKLTDLSCLACHSQTLQILNVSGNFVSRLDLPTPFSLLEELYLMENSLKKLPTFPRLFPNLQILDIRRNKVADSEELLHLRSCKSLRELYVADNPYITHHQEDVTPIHPADILSNLQVLDGVTLRRSSSELRSQAPLMRPMSATNVISARQVQMQMDSLQSKMDQLQDSLEKKFQSLRTRMNRLAEEEGSSAPSSADRPVSRASRRSRIMEARAFASTQYSNTS